MSRSICLAWGVVFLAIAGSAAAATPIEELAGLQTQVAKLHSAGQYREAEAVSRKLLAHVEKHFADNPQFVAIAAGNLGEVLAFQMRFAESEPWLKRQLAISEKLYGPNDPRVADVVKNLAAIYRELHKYDEAWAAYKRALDIYVRAYGGQHEKVAWVLTQAARLHHHQDRPAEAEPLFQQALAIYRQLRNPDQEGMALTLEALADLCLDQFRWDDAEKYFRQALTIRERINGPQHPDLVRVVSSLAIIYTRREQYAEAEPLFRGAVAILKQLYGEDHITVAYTTTNLATVKRELKKYDEAEPLYTTSIKILEKLYGPQDPRVAEALNPLAMMYNKQGRDKEALPLVQRCLKLLEASPSSTAARMRNLGLRAQILWGMNRRDEAMADLRQALDLIDTLRSQAAGAEFDRSRLVSASGSFYETMIAWQCELNDPAAAFEAMERSRSRSLLEQMRLQGVDLLAGLSPSYAKKLQDQEAAAKRQVAALEQQLAQIESTNDAENPQTAKRKAVVDEELTAARDRLLDVYRDIRNVSPVYRLGVSENRKPIELAQVKRWLGDKPSVMLQYFFGVDGGFVLAVLPGGEARVHSLSLDQATADSLGVKAGPLSAEVLSQIFTVGDETLLSLLSRPQHDSKLDARLAVLWRSLVPQSAQAALVDGAAKRLVVIPDGLLALIPFETLIVTPGPDPQYLLDVGPPIVYAPSGSVLMNLMERAKAKEPAAEHRAPILSVGDPIYTSARPTQVVAADRGTLATTTTQGRNPAARGALAPLPYSGRESKWVADVFAQHGQDADRLTKDQATEANVRAAIAGRRVVHLACHGFADEQFSNFFGALALSPGRNSKVTPADDGFLTLPEIYELNLRGCDLAILSACRTNYGPQQLSEGVWSLARGFLVAGSQRVVASNWLVDDEAAASLISYYCAGVAKRQAQDGQADYGLALQDARRWVRQQPKWRSPYYWGTFVLIGPN